MSKWEEKRLEDIIDVNPPVKLKKGESYPFIDIDKVSRTWERDRRQGSHMPSVWKSCSSYGSHAAKVQIYDLRRMRKK